jgi:hypothetical protein
MGDGRDGFIGGAERAKRLAMPVDRDEAARVLVDRADQQLDVTGFVGDRGSVRIGTLAPEGIRAIRFAYRHGLPPWLMRRVAPAFALVDRLGGAAVVGRLAAFQGAVS